MTFNTVVAVRSSLGDVPGGCLSLSLSCLLSSLSLMNGHVGPGESAHLFLYLSSLDARVVYPADPRWVRGADGVVYLEYLLCSLAWVTGGLKYNE